MVIRDSVLRIGRGLGRALWRTAAREAGRRTARRLRGPETGGGRPAGGASRPRSVGPSGTEYPGDFTGTASVEYTPAGDGRPDPGEIVWTWVPFEEDHGQGKDRPVLVVGRDGLWLLGLMLTSKDHDAPGGSRGGRDWLDVGTGSWDRQGRPSEVRLDRVLRINPQTVRREAARLDRARFTVVADALRARHGWR
jgi:PemK-like, MazF-like toxin of type II toxin-antitoxin system